MYSRLTGFLNTLIVYLLPQHGLSRLMRRITRIRTPAVKNMLIRLFVRRYRVDMSVAVQTEPSDYPDFNSFFTRALKPEARPLVSGADEIAHPVDGFVSQCGPIDGDRLIQAKGIDYRLAPLLGGSETLASEFTGGSFATLYLSPRDYHRIHMPCDGTLSHMHYVPGRLFSVDDYSTRHVRGLFTRNERLVTLFDTPAGPMALVLVGAILVSGIETVWAGEVSSAHPNGRWQRETKIHLQRGDEMGRFNMGSTVIVLFGPGRIRWARAVVPGALVRTRSLMGHVLTPEARAYP